MNMRTQHKENAYQMNGFATRREYLDDLAANVGVDESVVYALADILGPNEDFDGLVTELEDLIACGEDLQFD
jgi:hypothetical protein